MAKILNKTLVSAFSAAVLTAGVATTASADANPFESTQLNAGYDLVNFDKHAEGKCGEGKCGDDGKGKAEGKCGEGKCGEGKKAEGKEAEGKCGEGKCGS